MKQLRKHWSTAAAPLAFGLALTTVIASCGKAASPTSPSAANSSGVAGILDPVPDPTPDPTPEPTPTPTPPPPPPPGGEGCTPGYWKQVHHYDSWPAAYSPGMLFSDVFDDAFGDMTLAEVLDLGGGGLNALGRHTVAALLNGGSDGVNYDLTSAQVIAAFNSVYPGSDSAYETLKNRLAGLNEQGCRLD
jgi:hypothetical protein